MINLVNLDKAISIKCQKVTPNDEWSFWEETPEITRRNLWGYGWHVIVMPHYKAGYGKSDSWYEGEWGFEKSSRYSESELKDYKNIILKDGKCFNRGYIDIIQKIGYGGERHYFDTNEELMIVVNKIKNLKPTLLEI